MFLPKGVPHAYRIVRQHPAIAEQYGNVIVGPPR
jgi:hypothetical protein